MNKMIENEMNSMEFQEEEAPLFDFKQLWMLFSTGAGSSRPSSPV